MKLTSDSPIDSSVANGWESFAAAALPEHASDNQRAAMRTAFFSGAMVAVGIMLHASNRGDRERVAQLLDEIKAWSETVPGRQK